MQNLSIPHAPLAVNLPEGTYSHSLFLPHKIHPRTIPFIIPSEGVWGLCPHDYPLPLNLTLTLRPWLFLSYFRAGGAQLSSFSATSFK